MMIQDLDEQKYQIKFILLDNVHNINWRFG